MDLMNAEWKVKNAKKRAEKKLNSSPLKRTHKRFVENANKSLIIKDPERTLNSKEIVVSFQYF